MLRSHKLHGIVKALGPRKADVITHTGKELMNRTIYIADTKLWIDVRRVAALRGESVAVLIEHLLREAVARSQGVDEGVKVEEATLDPKAREKRVRKVLRLLRGGKKK